MKLAEMLLAVKSTSLDNIVQDLEDTAGSWDLYGQEDTKRYPGIQAEFFERAAGPLTRRNSILGFIALGTDVWWFVSLM